MLNEGDLCSVQLGDHKYIGVILFFPKPINNMQYKIRISDHSGCHLIWFSEHVDPLGE